MEEQQFERKFREMEQRLEELKSNVVGDMQMLKMMMGCTLGLQLMIFLIMIFGEDLTQWIGFQLGY